MSQEEYRAFLTRTDVGNSKHLVPPGSEIPLPPQQERRESALHNDILAETLRRGWIALHGSTAHRARRTPGEPDFVILADGGQTLLIECKTPTGKLSLEQMALKVQANKLGHTVHIVRSLDQFTALCKPCKPSKP